MQLEEAANKIRAEIVDARNNRWAEPGAHESLQALAVLNIWHRDTATAVSIIAASADRIDKDVSTKLITALGAVRNRQAFPMWTHQHRALVQVATAAIDALSPGHWTQSELWHLMGGGPRERKTLAKVVGRRSDPAQLALLAYLAHDRNPSVRCEATRWLCRWPLDPANKDQILALIRHMIGDPGVLVPLVAAEELRQSADIGDVKPELLQRLETHVSSAVRRRTTGNQGGV